MRHRKIADIEKARGSRVIMMIYRQETMRLLGFPIVRYIDMNDAPWLKVNVRKLSPVPAYPNREPIAPRASSDGGAALASPPSSANCRFQRRQSEASPVSFPRLETPPCPSHEKA